MVKTLKGRISLIFLVLVTLSALIGFTAVFNLYRLNNSIDGLMTANYKSIKAINKMIESIEKQDYAVLIFIAESNQKGFETFLVGQNNFLKAFSIENQNLTELGEKNLVSRLNTSYVEYLKSFAALQNIKDRSAALEFNNRIVAKKSGKIKLLLRNLADLNEKSMFSSKSEATDSAKHSLNLILIISLLAVIGGFATSRFFINRFFRPINMLIETVRRVQSGDLNQPAPVVYQDEIGTLAEEFNNMTRRLFEYEKSTVGQLMTEKNRTLAIVKSISDPLIVLDRQFRIQLINDAGESLFEVNEKNALDKHFLEVIKQGDLFEHIAEVTDTKDETKTKIVVIKTKATDSYFNVLVKVVRDEQDNASSIVILLQNITRIKQIEKIKTDFIATVSHEFKTPLTSVLMGISLILEKKLGSLNNEQVKLIQTIKDDGETLVKLVNDLLEISKIESGKSIFKMQSVLISKIIEDSARHFMEEAKKQEIKLTYKVAPDLPMIKADPEKVQWILNNLIGNALKYTKTGDEIKITATLHHEKICVGVRDTGVGIPPEYRDKVFDRFVQVQGYDLEVRGSGLGLAIAKEIVEAHGGEIWCESELEAGSTFIFTLPVS